MAELDGVPGGVGGLGGVGKRESTAMNLQERQARAHQRAFLQQTKVPLEVVMRRYLRKHPLTLDEGAALPPLPKGPKADRDLHRALRIMDRGGSWEDVQYAIPEWAAAAQREAAADAQRERKKYAARREVKRMALKDANRIAGDLPGFWGGEKVGDKIAGFFAGWGAGQYGDFPKIDTGKAIVPLRFSADLKNYFSKSEAQPPVGVYTVVMLIDLVDTGKPSPMKKYRVQFDFDRRKAIKPQKDGPAKSKRKKK